MGAYFYKYVPTCVFLSACRVVALCMLIIISSYGSYSMTKMSGSLYEGSGNNEEKIA